MFSSFATIYLAKMYFFFSIKDDLNNYLNSCCVSLMRRVDGMWQCVQCGFSKARKNHVVGMGTYLPFTKGNVSIFDRLNLCLSLFYLFWWCSIHLCFIGLFSISLDFNIQKEKSAIIEMYVVIKKELGSSWLNEGRNFHSLSCT